MKNKFREQTSQFLVVAFIGLLIIGFMFSGYESFQGQPDKIGEAGDYEIRFSEYQSQYNRNIQMLTRFNGGQAPTREEIERRQVKKTTIDQIVRQKVTLRIAEHLKATPSKKEVGKKIKEYPVFKTNEKFDINRYKGVLAANNLTPQAFEEDIKKEIQETSIRPVMFNQTVSESLLKDIQKIKKNSKLVKYITVSKRAIQSNLPVSKNEIKKFLQDKKNLDQAKAIFEQNKANYDQPAEYEISQIVFSVDDPSKESEVLERANEIRKKLTKKNFKQLANKHTEDPSHKKGSGGSLGKLPENMVLYQGMEVAFSQKPGTISGPQKSNFGYHIYFTEKKYPAIKAKFSKYQDEIAKSMIRQNKKDIVDSELERIVSDIKDLLNKGNDKKVNEIGNKYGLGTTKEKSINSLTLSNELQITKGELKKLLESKKKEVFVFKNAGYQSIFLQTNEKKELNESLDQIRSSLLSAFGQGLGTDTLKAIEELYPSKINQNLL